MTPLVVLTRPEGDNTDLEATLRHRGLDTLTVPLLRIEPLPDGEQPLPPDLRDGDICIFISANAVRMGLPGLLGPLVEHKVTAVGVGPRTAAALEAEGLSAVTPERADSEGLLALPELADVADRGVVLVKGEGGRSLIADTLRERGARVSEYLCYRRQPAEVDIDAFLAALKGRELTIFQASSGATLGQLDELIDRIDGSELRDQPVIVPSDRVADLGRQHGWTRVVAASNAGDPAFLGALETVLTPPEQDVASVQEDAVDEVNASTHGREAMSPSPNPDAGSGASTADSPAVRADRVGRVFGLLALVLMLATAVSAWWLAWPQWLARGAEVDALRARLATLETTIDSRQASAKGEADRQISALEARVAAALEDRLAREARERAEAREERRALLDRIERMDLRLARLTATDRRAWLANEAAFLVRLAGQRLLASRDVEAAEALLANADALLAETDDPRLETARRHIAADRLALRAAPKVDAVGLYARFSALTIQAAALQVAKTPSSMVQETGTDNDDWLARAEAGWQAALAKLSDYLVIRRRDAELNRMMTPEWEALVRQNLRMVLEQAQIAALSSNQALYDAALARAGEFVEAFREMDGARVTAIEAELDALAALDIAPELPSLTASRSALKEAIQTMDADGVGAAGSPAETGH